MGDIIVIEIDFIDLYADELLIFMDLRLFINCTTAEYIAALFFV
jgi:hypothetical protein